MRAIGKSSAGHSGRARPTTGAISVIIAVVALVAVGCSGGSEPRALNAAEGPDVPAAGSASTDGVVDIANPSASGGPIDPADEQRISDAAARLAGLATVERSSEERNAGADTDNADLNPAELDGLIAAYDNFLEVRDQARLGSPDELERLGQLAAPVVTDQVIEWRERNDRLRADGVHIGAVDSFSNAMIIAGDGRRVTINDCLEERLGAATMTLGATNFVDQIVTLTAAADGWMVEELEVRHDGTADEGRSGCAPSIHGAEVERVVDQYLSVVDGLWREPSSDPSPLDALAGDELASSVEGVRQSMADQGVHIPQDQVHRIETTGSDPAYGNAFFLAEICTSLPDGLAPVYVEGGEPVPVESGGYSMAPGSAIHREVLVSLEADEDGRVSGVVMGIEAQTVDSDCDER